MLELVRAAGEHFSPERYLVLTQIEGALWTLADYVIVFYAIRLCNVVRMSAQTPPHRIPYLILAATLPAAILLPIAPTGAAVFRLELVVTFPHFGLLLYLAARNLKTGAELLSRLRANKRSAQSTPSAQNDAAC